jgi:hypothetical protein
MRLMDRVRTLESSKIPKAVEILALSLCVGCVTTALPPKMNWANREGLPPTKADDYECTRDATQFFGGAVGGSGPINAALAKRDSTRLYIQCMESKGYKRKR